MKFRSQIAVRENVMLAPLTTLGVGGAARYFVEAETETAVIAALNFAREQRLPLFILGGGSNLLVSDHGFNGLVLKISLRGLKFDERKSAVLVTAQAGEDWDSLVKLCVAKNLAGFECLSGIPGTVGGTPVQNVGAYGQEVAETIVSVRVVARETGIIDNLANADCKFAYRTSIFNTSAREKFVVLAVTYQLRPNGEPTVRYKDLQKYFETEPAKPLTLQTVRAAVLEIRRAKSMVIDSDDPNSQSAGSFFKNPIVSPAQISAIAGALGNNNQFGDEATVPRYAFGENFKIPAAWLIEKSGFEKGYARGRAGISSNHTLAIVNQGGARATEIVELMREIQTRVNEKFGILLQPEPNLLGFES